MHKLTGIDYNYHTHTFRCGHAYGTDEEFVLEAINQGFRFIGFADHGIVKRFACDSYLTGRNALDNTVICNSCNFFVR